MKIFLQNNISYVFLNVALCWKRFPRELGWQFTAGFNFLRAKTQNRRAKINDLEVILSSNFDDDALNKMINVRGWLDALNLKISWAQILYRGSKNMKNARTKNIDNWKLMHFWGIFLIKLYILMYFWVLRLCAGALRRETRLTVYPARSVRAQLIFKFILSHHP